MKSIFVLKLLTMDKKLLIYVLLLICLFLMCSALSVITPFFPPFAIKKGISEEIVGFIIGANPIGAFFASLALGKILNDVISILSFRIIDFFT